MPPLQSCQLNASRVPASGGMIVFCKRVFRQYICSKPIKRESIPLLGDSWEGLEDAPCQQNVLGEEGVGLSVGVGVKLQAQTLPPFHASTH
jgi:hypothetical protein